MNAPGVRKVVRDADYSWGTSAMMNLYSGTTCPYSHRCRIVLYEKQMDFQVIDVDLYNKPEDIAVINPYNRVPVPVDRDLVLYESNIINEYIDERFPHPQLMPPYRIAAIGDPVKLQAAIAGSVYLDAYRQTAALYSLGYDATTSTDLTIKAYDGITKLRHATVATIKTN